MPLKRLLYHSAKKSKMTKNSNQGGSCLKGKMKAEKTFPQGELNCQFADLLPKTFLSFPEGRSSEIAKYAADVRTDCEKIARAVAYTEGGSGGFSPRKILDFQA